MRPRLAVAAGIAALVGGCGGDEGPASPSTEKRAGSPSGSAVSSCREAILGQAEPQWRRRSSVTVPFRLIGAGQDFRDLPRQGEWFVAKLPAIVARGEIVKLRVPSRKQGSVALGYAGVTGHVTQVTFKACADQPVTGWPGQLVLKDRRPVTLVVEVEGEPRAPVRVGHL